MAHPLLLLQVRFPERLRQLLRIEIWIVTEAAAPPRLVDDDSARHPAAGLLPRSIHEGRHAHVARSAVTDAFERVEQIPVVRIVERLTLQGRSAPALEIGRASCRERG